MQDLLDQTAKQITTQVGMGLMAAAAIASMLDPTAVAKKVVVPSQAVLVPVEANAENMNPLRREKEESAPHYISYSVSQRTPGRAKAK